jgi:hypothetical protein
MVETWPDPHKIEVTITANDMKVQTRRSYLAAEGTK